MMLCKSPLNPEAEIVRSTYFCMHVCAVGLCMSHYTCSSQDKSALSYQMGTCGGQRTIVLVSSLLVPGIKLKLSDFTFWPLQFVLHQPNRREEGEEEEGGFEGLFDRPRLQEVKGLEDWL